MLAFTILDTKEFMALLLKNTAFDHFRLRHFEAETFTQFEISGQRNFSFYTAEEQENIAGKFCSWQEIRPYAFDLIKGKHLPKKIKIIFSLDESQLKQFPNASALFLNIQFENGTLTCTTGCSQQSFSLDKSLDEQWDSWVQSLMKSIHIACEPAEV